MANRLTNEEMKDLEAFLGTIGTYRLGGLKDHELLKLAQESPLIKFEVTINNMRKARGEVHGAKYQPRNGGGGEPLPFADKEEPSETPAEEEPPEEPVTMEALGRSMGSLRSGIDKLTETLEKGMSKGYQEPFTDEWCERFGASIAKAIMDTPIAPFSVTAGGGNANGSLSYDPEGAAQAELHDIHLTLAAYHEKDPDSEAKVKETMSGFIKRMLDEGLEAKRELRKRDGITQ